MRYQVIVGFYDLEDDWRRYEAGDTYPRPGLTPAEARVAFLAGDQNHLGRPVIRAVEEKPKRKRGKPDA